MAKRQSVFLVPSDEVQGEGSWIKLKAIKYGLSKRVAVELEGVSDAEKLEVNARLIAEHLLGWNWVDDNDEPLPVPSENPDVLDDLTSQELEFIGEAMQGTVARKKS